MSHEPPIARPAAEATPSRKSLKPLWIALVWFILGTKSALMHYVIAKYAIPFNPAIFWALGLVAAVLITWIILIDRSTRREG